LQHKLGEAKLITLVIDEESLRTLLRKEPEYQ
jgi:hypothetical protein